MKINNSSGKIWYGIHFYPGVAEYKDGPDKEPYRVFLNESTLRTMDPSFAGKPVFFEHVDEVEPDINELRKESDGWVIESFFNSSDGKHWVKFITVSDKAERAIKNGFKLSNAYRPKSFSKGGLWNGVSYLKEIIEGEYEHLAIVNNPRYEESEILNPEQFKDYNDNKFLELKRLSNSKGDSIMKFSIFKKSKVENAFDPELSIILPKSGKEMTFVQIINSMDEMEDAKKKNEVMADMDHKVKMHDGSMCNVAELMEKHKAMHDELEMMKKEKKDSSDEEGKKEDELEKESGLAKEEHDVEVEGDLSNDESEDKDAKKKALQLAEHEEKEIEAAKKKNAKAKADALKNAHIHAFKNAAESAQVIELASDKVARGKSLYGSK